MINKILDSNEGSNAIVIMNDSNSDYLELYLEGKFEINNDDKFHEGTRIELSEYDVEILAGFLYNWLGVHKQQKKSKSKSN